MSLFFRAAYRFGFKPWDSGVTAPELVAFVESNPGGKALDLGCGTGTNCIYLAQHGWDVTGVDFVPRAIRLAKTKAQRAGVTPRLIVGDVTRLVDMGVGDGYRLIFDVGCFHSIPDSGRAAYVRGATAVAAPGATMLLFCFLRGEGSRRPGPRGVARGEVRERFATTWDVVSEQAGSPFAGYEAAWYTLRKR
ncbi:MAG TPA: methyltransferase domain-containing protein [Candidatus Dormibacteraeota bacterium]|nr:methyltransferase domain-containing protein [Candidatus Dormibacteraeota bacterium]